MEFSVSDFACDVLEDLRKQRETAEFCDITLQVSGDEGGEISAHKCVLASASDYFRTLFSSSFSDRDTGVCHLPNVTHTATLLVVDFMYTGKVTISFENVVGILQVADFLCMDRLKGFCSDLLRSCLSPETGLRIKLLVDRYSLKEIAHEALDFISPIFEQILRTPEALELPITTLVSLLQDNRLNYIQESSLCECLMRWADYDRANRTQFIAEILSLIDFTYLTKQYLEANLLTSAAILAEIERNPEIKRSIADVLSREQIDVRPLDDVIICRSRTVRMCEEVKLLLYFPRDDRWSELSRNPEPHCWDGLESMIYYQGDVYFLVSKTEDMYGYMHHAEENKYFWKLDLRRQMWVRCAAPEVVRGQCRLVSHINGLYAMDRHGVIEEFDVKENRWRAAGSPGFTEDPSATMYFLPMPADRYIYVLRAFSAGYSFRYARTSFSLHKFDTIRHSWEALSSDVEADDLNLGDNERLHGYTITPGYITFKNELGLSRVTFDTTNQTWSSVTRGVTLPSFVKDVWGSVSFRTRQYFVGRMTQEAPMLMFYDHEKVRFKAVRAPAIFLSGLLCHVLAPSPSLSWLTSSSLHDGP